MLDIDPDDIVLTRRTADGRFVIFTPTDVQPGWPLRWWGTVADTGGDGFGFLVRLDADAAPAGWTARQLLAVVLQRMADEAVRLPLAITLAAVASLEMAAASLATAAGISTTGAPVTFTPGGGEPSPYPWTDARRGKFQLPLWPDPESAGEGIAPEQLPIVLDQLLLGAARARTDTGCGQQAATRRRRWPPRSGASPPSAARRKHRRPTDATEHNAVGRDGVLPRRACKPPHPKQPGMKALALLLRDCPVIITAITIAIRIAFL